MAMNMRPKHSKKIALYQGGHPLSLCAGGDADRERSCHITVYLSRILGDSTASYIETRRWAAVFRRADLAELVGLFDRER
jgi:hypothetical protein